jgi:16S rRNA (cytidine1402-2'-O)-methyltransferase
MSSASVVYLIPSMLHETATTTIPVHVVEAIKNCQVFFVENERSARRYLKAIWKEIVIDDHTWVLINKSDETTALAMFRSSLKEGKNIGIISEAGCPGVADPGQQFVAIAQEMNVIVKPLVGPNSILLALMASGMNGQQFQFAGYLPIDSSERTKAIKHLESESRQKNCTQIFIETPYRNNQLLETLIKTLHPQTKVCVAVDLTASTEIIQTKTAQQWKAAMPQLHKRPAIFLLYAGSEHR